MFQFAERKLIVSISISIALILLLVIAGPAEAVRIEADTEKANYKTNEEVIFKVSVDANVEEDIQTLTIILNGNELCTFDKEANIISGCDDIEVTLDEKIGYPDTRFDYTLKLTGQNEGRYKGYVRVNEANKLSRLINFYIREQPRPAVERRLSLRGENGDIENIFGEAGFENERTSLTISLREVIDGENTQGAGTIIFTTIGKKDDSTRAELRLRMDPINIEEFSNNMIKLKGQAGIDYHRTKKGIWSSGTGWIGREDPVRIKKDISSVEIIIDINNEVVDVISNAEEEFAISDIDVTSLRIR